MRRSKARALALSATLAAAGYAHTARAQDAGGAAGRAFQAGTQAYAHGDFRVAAASFDEAYRIAPRGAAAYNAGLAWEAAGDGARASDDYAQALRAGDLGAVERADTTGRLKNLESKVGRLSIFAPDDAHLWLDGQDVTDAARGLHVTAGRHTLRVEYGDKKDESRTVRVAAGEMVEIRPAEHGEAAPARVAPEPSRSVASDAPAPSSVQDHIPAFVAFGGGVVASVLAIYFFERGLSARNDFENPPSNKADPSLHDQAETFRTLTWVSWSAAAVCAGVGAALYLTETPSSPSASPGAALELGPRGVTLRVGF